MHTRRKTVKWIRWKEAETYPEHDNYEEVRECVIEEIIRTVNCIDGLYHDAGKCVIPVFDDETKFTTQAGAVGGKLYIWHIPMKPSHIKITI